MNHPTDAEMPLDVPATPAVGKEASESTTTEAQTAALSALPNENGIDKPKENIVQTAKTEPASWIEQPIANGALQKTIAIAQQEVQSPTQETDGNTRGDAEQSNGDASGNVRIPADADLSKPERKNGEQLEGGVKKVRRSSTLSTITQKTKAFIPRGKVHRRTAASHGRSGGGCVIF
ncbi:hypothetical protein ACEPAF_1394 [Sanghuangporus sanghuang]